MDTDFTSTPPGTSRSYLVIRRLVRPSLTAEFRFQIFELRRELFLELADRAISPRHPAYVRLRSLQNGLLATAERWSGFRVVMYGLFMQKTAKETTDETALAISKIEDPEVRKRFESLYARTSLEIARHFMRMTPFSPILLLAYLAYTSVALASGMTKSMFSWSNPLIRGLGAEAVQVGGFHRLLPA